MDLQPYLRLLARWWWLLVGGTFVSALLAYAVTSQLPRVYAAHATLLVDAAQGRTGTYEDSLLSQQLVKTYVQLATQPVVLNAAAQRARLAVSPDALSRVVTAEPVRDTQLFTITAQATDPAQAQALANALAQSFIDQQEQLGQQPDAVKVAQPAQLPTEPVQPRVLFDVAVAAVLVFLLLHGAVLANEFLDGSVKDAEDVERAVALPVLGGPASARWIRRGAWADSYWPVRAGLEPAALPPGHKVLLVTSPGLGEGKSATATSVAIGLARAGKDVVLIDANLRAPALDAAFGYDSSGGLSDLLLRPEDSAVESFLRPGPAAGLQVLPAGRADRDPAELFAGPEFGCVLARLADTAQVIVVDGPPVLSFAETLALAEHADSALLLAQLGGTRRMALRRAVTALERTGIQLAGVILTSNAGWRGMQRALPTFQIGSPDLQRAVWPRAALGQRAVWPRAALEQRAVWLRAALEHLVGRIVYARHLLHGRSSAGPARPRLDSADPVERRPA